MTTATPARPRDRRAPRPSAGLSSGLPPRLAAAAAPLRPVALGVAVGLLVAVVFALVTLAHLLVLPGEAWHLELLGQYLRGYHVTPVGVVIGAAWGGVLGFAAGWLLAVSRNAAVRCWLEIVRARASLEKSEFLDGI
jgi:hypothetical protein